MSSDELFHMPSECQKLATQCHSSTSHTALIFRDKLRYIPCLQRDHKLRHQDLTALCQYMVSYYTACVTKLLSILDSTLTCHNFIHHYKVVCCGLFYNVVNKGYNFRTTIPLKAMQIACMLLILFGVNQNTT